MGLASRTDYEVLLFDEEGETWEADERLALAVLTRPVWPDLPTAEFVWRLGGFGGAEKRMEDGADRALLGRRILARKAGAGGACVFVGHVTGIEPAWGDAESCRVYAKHLGTLLQEHVIQGAWSRGYGDFYEGAPLPDHAAHFGGYRPLVNPEGYASASITKYQVEAEDVCRVFAPAGSIWATPWSVKDLLGYLFFFADEENPFTVQGEIAWPGLGALGEGDLVEQPRDLDLEGRSWWEAIGEALRFSGWRCRMETGGTGAAPTALLKIWQLGTGTARTIRLGPAGADLTLADNAAEGQVNLDASGLVNLPKVWGGPLLLEGSWPLVPGWKAADLDATASPDESADPGENPDVWDDTYYRRYVDDAHAADFASYRDVGRRWVLNEAGDYSTAAYGSPAVFDFGVATGEGVWVRRKRPFERPISQDALGRHVPIRVEISYDAGTTWQPLSEARELDDECGVRITAKDLSRIGGLELTGSGWPNLWDMLCADKTNSTRQVQVRATACVADDSALAPDPALAVPAWSPLARAVEAPYERRTRYQRRVRLESGAYESQWTDVYANADTASDALALGVEAAVIQRATATLQVRGSIVLDNTQYVIDPGDTVRELAGRGISFRADLAASGAPEVYAEVVGVTLTLGDDEDVHQLEVVLEDWAVRLVR